MDSSKVNYILMPRSIPIEKIDILVSDGKLKPEIVQVLESKGVQVL